MICNKLSSTFENNVFIFSNSTGHNKIDCITNSSIHACATLDYVFGIMSNESKFPELAYKLRRSTKIEVYGEQFLQENYNLTGLYYFALRGVGDVERSVVKCKSHRGLVILSSEDVAIEHMTFVNCGSIQRNEDIKNVSFQAGLFFSNITNVSVTDCIIINSTGIGMALLNVGGHVMFAYTKFIGNMNISTNGSKVKSGLAHVGGGIIIEFTYNDTENIQSSNNNHYMFYKCSFIRNGCKWNTKNDPEPKEADKNHVIFGCGGGLGMTFKENAHGNIVHLMNCTFAKNLADWGGGYYFFFDNKSQNNSVHLSNVTAESNHAVFSGGGGRFYFTPCFNYTEILSVPRNYFHQELCHYLNNYAGWGGGVSVFGSTVYNEDGKHQSLLFSNCHWISNKAIVASALGFVSNAIRLQQWYVRNNCSGLPYTVELKNCEFRENKISTTFQENKKFLVGIGTVYVDEAPIRMQNVYFTLNDGTPLVLDLTSVYIRGYVSFYSNSGDEGGAIALYGRSTIILHKNSNLTFVSNTAHLRGGAIFAYSQGPNLKAFQVHLLYRSTCFFSYIEPGVQPSSWSGVHVVFQNNSAPSGSGKSVYCDTLQFCRAYGSIKVALQWKPVFKYLNSTPNEPEIVTDPVEINTTNSDWTGFPGQQLIPNITLFDEKEQKTNGLFKMSLTQLANSKVKVGKHVSKYIYISDGRSSVPVSFESKNLTGRFNLTLSSVYTQVIKTTVGDINMTQCYGGYEFDKEKQKCACIPQQYMPYGYTRCGKDLETVYLKVGYWATVTKDGTFVVLPCPVGYCRCVIESAYGNNECMFTKFQTKTKQCAKNRSGRLCGSCDEGYSLVVGLNECRMCPNNTGLLWLLAVVAGLTLVVLAIIYFEIDFFSGPLNSWLYTYHIVFLLPDKTEYLDPFTTFVISLTNGLFDLSTGACFWKGMDALQKLTLQYLMPFYCTFLLYGINKLLRNFPNLRFADRFHRAFVTVVIVSYASLIETTVSILHPVHIGDGWYVFRQAEVPFFSKDHLPYAIPALLILLFIVIPFPFVIAFSSYFLGRFQRLRNFIPLFEAIQNPYRPNRRWFASYYIFCRLIFITLLIFRNVYEHTLFPFLEAVCVIILLIFVLLRPYNDENYVYANIDACFLSLLCLIICFVNAMEANADTRTVEFFQVLTRISTYIPFTYSLVLFIRYVYRRITAYKERRAGRNEQLI